MKKVWFIKFFWFPVTVFAQESHYNKWFWADGKAFVDNPVVNGPIEPAVQAIRALTGREYLCLEIHGSVWNDGATFLFFLYKPLIRKPVLISTTDTATLQQEVQRMEAKNYLMTPAFVNDFNYLKDKLHATKEYMESILGKPDQIIPNELLNGVTYEYAKEKFVLKFSNGLLVSFSLYKKDKVLNSLIKKYGERFGIDLYYKQVSEAMTKNMVIQAIGKPYKSMHSWNGIDDWIYKRPFATKGQVNFYQFNSSGKLSAICDESN
jgi:hypothetical protein